LAAFTGGFRIEGAFCSWVGDVSPPISENKKTRKIKRCNPASNTGERRRGWCRSKDLWPPTGMGKISSRQTLSGAIRSHLVGGGGFGRGCERCRARTLGGKRGLLFKNPPLMTMRGLHFLRGSLTEKKTKWRLSGKGKSLRAKWVAGPWENLKQDLFSGKSAEAGPKKRASVFLHPVKNLTDTTTGENWR